MRGLGRVLLASILMVSAMDFGPAFAQTRFDRVLDDIENGLLSATSPCFAACVCSMLRAALPRHAAQGLQLREA